MDWQMFADVATKMHLKVPYDHREDMRQEIIVRLAERDVKTKSLAYIVARQAIVDWWRHERYRLQTHMRDWEVFDSEGNSVPIVDLIQANEPDFESWLDAKEALSALPFKLVRLATKKVAGLALTKAEHEYLRRWRKDRQQLRLAQATENVENQGS